MKRIVILLGVALSLTTSLLACGAAQTPPVELHGKVVWAAALHPDRCHGGNCQATYQVRIVNGTDAVLFVPECRVLQPPARGVRRVPIMDLGGLAVRAGGTETYVASSRLRAAPSEIHRLKGAALSCFGTDGTGQFAE